MSSRNQQSPASVYRGPRRSKDGVLDFGLKPVGQNSARIRQTPDHTSNSPEQNDELKAALSVARSGHAKSGLPMNVTVPQMPPDGVLSRSQFQSRGSQVPGRNMKVFSGMPSSSTSVPGLRPGQQDKWPSASNRNTPDSPERKSASASREASPMRHRKDIILKSPLRRASVSGCEPDSMRRPLGMGSPLKSERRQSDQGIDSTIAQDLSSSSRRQMPNRRASVTSEDSGYRRSTLGGTPLSIQRKSNASDFRVCMSEPGRMQTRSRVDASSNDEGPLPRLALEERFAMGAPGPISDGQSFLSQSSKTSLLNPSASTGNSELASSASSLAPRSIATTDTYTGESSRPQETTSRTREMQTFQQAHEFAMANPPSLPQKGVNEQPGWGHLVPSLGKNNTSAQEDDSPPELTEAMREDLLFRLDCARESGYLNLTYHLWPEIPDEVAKFLKDKGHNLKALNFEGNQSKLLPDSFEKMRMLVSLNLGGNQLPQVPCGVDKLHLLTSLCLEKNCIRALPDTLGNCKSLTYLDVSHNQITWLPDSFKNLKQLMTLKVSSNRMCHLPEQICMMRDLKEINASHNAITGIPVEIGTLPKLQLLRLDHNKLTALPDSIGGLWRTLVEFSVGHNPLTILPLSLGACKKIDTLDLASCPWAIPPPEIVLQGTERVLTYLSSTGSNMSGGSDPRYRGLKAGKSQRKSHKNIADMIAQIGKDLQQDHSHEVHTECGHCIKLYNEIADWKKEVKQLAEEIADRDEELEELQQDNAEIRDSMLRKQNKLRETDEAVQTLIREKKEANILIERLRGELEGRNAAAAELTDAAEIDSLQDQMSMLQEENDALRRQLDKSEADLLVANDDLKFQKDQELEKDRLLQELQGSLKAAEERAEQAKEAEESAVRAAAEGHAPFRARIAELEHNLATSAGAREQIISRSAIGSFALSLNFQSSLQTQNDVSVILCICHIIHL